MIDRLRSRLVHDEPVYICWSILRDPQLIGALARQGFDAILLDGQHGFHTEQSCLEGITQIVNAGKSPLVRIPVGRWDMAERMLDFGALGIVAPMINTSEDAAAFANACKYPQLGERSFGPAYVSDLYGVPAEEYLHAANRSTFALAQIETREAYENLDEIIGIDGIDGVLMGPGDFSISMTGNLIPDSYGPDTIEAIADIATRTRNAGKVAAAFTDNPDHFKTVKALGYTMISVMIDQAIAEMGAQIALSRVKD